MQSTEYRIVIAVMDVGHDGVEIKGSVSYKAAVSRRAVHAILDGNHRDQGQWSMLNC